jgi:hypothetical protein
VLGGVGSHAFARSWGRAGVGLVLLLSAACSTRVDPSAAPPTNVRGATGDAADTAIVAPATFEGEPAPAVAPPVFAAAPAIGPTGTGVWAVVIGITDYPGRSHDLAYARNDAADIVAVLERAGQPQTQRVVLTDATASAATIGRALDWLVANAGPDATAVVYFAGHVRKLAPSTEAFVGADGQVVPDHVVARHLAPLRAGRTWLVVAGCYGGGFTEALAPGRLLTAAAPAGALAYETTQYRRSYLGEFLVRRGLLEGEGGPTVQTSFAFAEREIRRSHPGRVPVQIDGGAPPIALTDGRRRADITASPTAPPRPQPARPAQPPPAPPPTTSTAPARPRSEPSCLLTAGALAACPGARDD